MPDRTDDLGTIIEIPSRISRVVSLVPSLTEAIATSAPELLVGATDWCTHTVGLSPTRVRGTKNPDLAAIADLAPDLVVANREENRLLDVERLRARGISVWVTRIENLAEAFASLDRLFRYALARTRPAWLSQAEVVWAQPIPTPRRTAVVPIWRDPWMVVGSSTFTGDLLAHLGLENVFGADADRYPHVSLEQIEARNPEVVVLPDEPYPFSASDGPEAFPNRRVARVDGRDLTWYGPSLVEARSRLLARLTED